MDLLTFVAQVLNAIAWPLAVTVMFLAVRGRILELIPTLRHLKWKDIEIEFQKEMSLLKEEAILILPAPRADEAKKAVQTVEKDRLMQLAEISPRSAIVEAWVAVESAAAQIVENLRVTDTKWTALRLGDILHSQGILSAERLRIYKELHALRNKAVHNELLTVGPDQAKNYVDLALRMIESLPSHGKRPV